MKPESRANSDAKEAAASPRQDEAAPSASAEHAAPIERLNLDVVAEEPDAPWGGLRVEMVGPSLSETDRVVVLLHGYGADALDLVRLAQILNEQVSAAYVIPDAPFLREGGGRAWFRRDRSNFDEGVHWAGRVLAYAQTLEGKAIVLGGFSQGAMMTLNLLSRARSGLQGALLLSTADEWRHLPAQEAPRVPVFLSHGHSDPIIPFEHGERVRNRLKALGYEVSWVEFDGRHSIPAEVLLPMRQFLGEVFAR